MQDAASGCTGMTDTRTLEEAKIREARMAFNDAIVRKDLPAIAALLRDDYAVMPSFAARCFDKQGILDVYRDHFSDPGFITFERVPERIILSPNRQRAAELGHWRGLWRAGSEERGRAGIYHAAWLPSALGWTLTRESYVLLEG